MRAGRPRLIASFCLVAEALSLPTWAGLLCHDHWRLNLLGISPRELLFPIEAAALLPAIVRILAATHMILARKRLATVLRRKGWHWQTGARNQISKQNQTRTESVGK